MNKLSKNVRFVMYSKTSALLAITAGLAGCSGGVDSGAAPAGPFAPGAAVPGAPVTGIPGDGTVQPGVPVVDPVTGQPVDPVTGQPVDPVTGQPVANPVPGSACTPGLLSMGSTPLTRLSSQHVSNSIRDIFGVEADLGSLAASDESGGDFVANIDAPVSDPVVANYAAIAEGAASGVVGRFDNLTDCGNRDAACARAFVDQYAPLVYRRPLEAGEAELLMTAFEAGVEESFETGIRLVVEAMLQSPYFLYRDETRGQEVTPGINRLTGYELATRLSLALHNTTPSAELMQLAASGALDTPAGIASQVDQMMADEAFNASIADFHHQWLDLDGLVATSKDEDFYPDFDGNVRDAMIQEVERFTQQVIRDGDAKLETLLTAPYTFIDREMFSVYGLDDPGGDHDPSEQVALDPTQRSGLLTMPALLARFANPDSSSPTLRGVWVRESLICQHLPAPPADVDTSLPEFDPNITTAERFALHAESPACAGCHELIDPIGLGFEHYDGIGQWRTKEGNDLTVSASGRVIALADGDVEFYGAPELARALAATPEVQQCMTQQWFNYTVSRPDQAADACSMETSFQAFQASGFDIRVLVRSVLTSDAFRHVQLPQ